MNLTSRDIHVLKNMVSDRMAELETEINYAVDEIELYTHAKRRATELLEKDSKLLSKIYDMLPE